MDLGKGVDDLEKKFNVEMVRPEVQKRQYGVSGSIKRTGEGLKISFFDRKDG